MDTIDRTYFSGATLGPAEPATEKPLTLSITDRLDSNIQTAAETRHRLVNLRDRIFGALPEQLSGAEARPDYSCFGDAAQSKGAHLAGLLNEIDSLTHEIANRL